jgi:hypothetical protein
LFAASEPRPERFQQTIRVLLDQGHVQPKPELVGLSSGIKVRIGFEVKLRSLGQTLQLGQVGLKAVVFVPLIGVPELQEAMEGFGVERLAEWRQVLAEVLKDGLNLLLPPRPILVSRKMPAVQRFIFHTPQGDFAWVGHRVVLCPGEQTLLEEQRRQTLRAGRVRKIGVQRGVAEAFGRFKGHELKPQVLMQVPDEVTEAPLRFRVRVEVLDVDDEGFRNLLGLPRFSYPASLFGDSDGGEVKLREIKGRTV